jgi:nicotinate-nucleotide pyrophosphorylase (carboxylating)
MTKETMMHAGQADFSAQELVEKAAVLVDLALHEDLGPAADVSGDLTATATIASGRIGQARIEARQNGRICGLPIVREIFERVGGADSVQLRFHVEEGADVISGQRLVEISGNLRVILAAERTALNFLGRLSGIATAASKASAFSETRPQILDTRKTTPGWRYLEKYAVAKGGAQNHRLGLTDMFLIKENHIRAAGGIQEALEAARQLRQKRSLSCSIEIEVETFAELESAIEHGADIVMLDNFVPADLHKARDIAAGRVLLEVSGGITPETLPEFAATGVDFLSMGALTHSSPSFDCSLLVEDVQ